MRSHDPQQDRFRYTLNGFVKEDLLSWGLLPEFGHVCLLYFYVRLKEALVTFYASGSLFKGELDPERMGSGIQYGDASLRQLRQPRGTTTQNRQQCNC